MSALPQDAIDAHDAYWRVKETGDPPPFGELPVKLQQCWTAAAAVVAAAERERIRQLALSEAIKAHASSFSVAGPIAAGALEDFAELLTSPEPQP